MSAERSGFWFNTLEGSLIIGHTALDSQIEQTGPGDIVPLAKLVGGPDFPFDHKSFPGRPTAKEWTTDDYVATGHWALRLVKEVSSDATFAREHLIRLSQLGLSRGISAFVSRFHSFTEFKGALGQGRSDRYIRHRLFDEWTIDHYKTYARGLAAQLKGKPKTEDYKRASQDPDNPGPSFLVITRDVGGIGALNELIGFPDIRSWDEDAYKNWGVRAMRANGGLSRTVIAQLSRAKRGPSVNAIRNHFTSLGNFQRLVEEAIEREDEERAMGRQLAIERARLLVSGGTLDRTFAEADEDTLLQASARFAVVRACAPDAPPERVRSIIKVPAEDFAIAVRSVAPRLSTAQIEMEAVGVRAYDIIWGSRSNGADLEDLKVA